MSLQEEEKHRNQDAQEDRHVPTEAKFGVVHLQAKEHQQTLDAKRGKEGFSPNDFISKYGLILQASHNWSSKVNMPVPK